jgi:long-chain acyl-CoA synthetase
MSEQSMAAWREDDTRPPLDVAKALKGKDLIVIGCTGFLGKVWLSKLLYDYPEVGTLFLMVRPKSGLSSEERFWSDVAPSPVFDPIREKHPGAAYEAFMREKIRPISGDVANAHLGFADELRDEMRGRVSAIVNIAGVVDFNPPLDEALNVNAFGAQNLVDTARDLGDIALFHTSTCFVAGCRSGVNPERNTLEFPFPRADELDPEHWNARNEIAECVDVVEQTRRRVEDAPRQSHLLDEAKRNLEKRGEPQRGAALDDELKKVKRKFVRERLIEAGRERATFWGWPNIYTYTKSIGEQVFLSSGLPILIARPAIIESSIEYPVPGWCEGINTTSPFVYLSTKGIQHFAVSDHSHLDIIPVDRVSNAMTAGLAALLERRHPDVFQICSSDVNPLKTKRVARMLGLAKRRHFKNKSTGNQLVNLLAAHTEPNPVSQATFERVSAPAFAKHSKTVSRWLDKAKDTQLANPAKRLKKKVDAIGRQSANVAKLYSEFQPFTVDVEFRFSAKNTRKLISELSPADAEKLVWDVESIDWLHFWMEVQDPGLRKYSMPLLDERLKKEIKPHRRHDNLVAMLADRLEDDEHKIVLHRLEGEQLTNISYRDLWELSGLLASRLAAAGVSKGDRVALGGANHPNWAVAYFGILRAGATAVPVDKEYEAPNLQRVLEVSESKIAILDEVVVTLDSSPCPRWDLHEATAEAKDQEKIEVPEVEIADEDIASILYTSGTTGDPKGVMLSHENFTALIASLVPLFPLDKDDRMVSVLPLHHTFEFTCGLMLPLARGTSIVYLDEVDGDRLATGLEVGRATAMVGVPALWELLERRITNKVSDKGKAVEAIFNTLLEFNRNIGKNTGLDLGRLFFGEVHRGLGGNLRTLISGAAALPKDVHETFQGLGLHIAEGYGLTEAAPVLTVAKGGAKNRGGNVGKAIPGVEIRIDNPNDEGVGEVLARGPNVMQGYAGNDAATRESLDADGWLHTGDLGKLDKRERLTIVGRSKEVILSGSGENVYPDDVESMLGLPSGVKELSIVGLADDKGGERVACLAVADEDEELDHAERRSKAERNLKAAIDKLPRVMRPTLLRFSDAELPRTSTKKIKRKAVVSYLERVLAASKAAAEARNDGDAKTTVVRSAVATIAKKDPKSLRLDDDLAADLGFDSLMVVELAAAIETHAKGIDPQRLAEAKTVGELEALISAGPSKSKSTSRSDSKTKKIEKEEIGDVEVPEFIREPAKKLLSRGQFGFYDIVMKAKVSGKANIPHNRNTIVIANHASHVDMGLVKYALGGYGENLVALAAEDYFFGNDLKGFWFKNFTNMAALDRSSGLRKTLRQTGEHLDRGRTILIFPEGTRSPDGKMREFMPVIGHLALNHDTDILPLWLGGTYDAFPKGSKIPIPRRRNVKVRIGPTIRVQDMERHTEGLKRADSYRKVAKMAQSAVEALRDGHQVDFSREALGPAAVEGAAPSIEVVTSAAKKDSPMTALFKQLEVRFVPGAVEGRTSFYFSLGDGSDGKWNLVVDAEAAVFARGKPEGGKADCVLKTSPEIFTKIVKERYTPSVAEFMAGKVKSNDIQLLQVFQKAFDL